MSAPDNVCNLVTIAPASTFTHDQVCNARPELAERILAHLRAFMLELPHMLIRLSGISRNESAGVPARLTARESETMPTTCNMKKSKELRRSLEHPPVRR